MGSSSTASKGSPGTAEALDSDSCSRTVTEVLAGTITGGGGWLEGAVATGAAPFVAGAAAPVLLSGGAGFAPGWAAEVWFGEACVCAGWLEFLLQLLNGSDSSTMRAMSAERLVCIMLPPLHTYDASATPSRKVLLGSHLKEDNEASRVQILHVHPSVSSVESYPVPCRTPGLATNGRRTVERLKRAENNCCA